MTPIPSRRRRAARGGGVAVKRRRGGTAPALFRYGFVALILIVWEIVGPFINPIFFSYPSKIAVAFYELTSPASCRIISRKVSRSWSTA